MSICKNLEVLEMRILHTVVNIYFHVMFNLCFLIHSCRESVYQQVQVNCLNIEIFPIYSYKPAYTNFMHLFLSAAAVQ